MILILIGVTFIIHNSNQLKRLSDFFNLKQKVNEYTRISSHSKTLIDHVYSNFDSVSTVTCLDLKITDHETLVINVEDTQEDDNAVKLKCWKKYSKQAVSRLVERNMDFQTTDSLDVKSAVLTDVLKTCTNELVEQKIVSLKNSNSCTVAGSRTDRKSVV